MSAGPGRVAWTTCCYPGCFAALGTVIDDDGAGSSRYARCSRHREYIYPCPRCLLYSHAARVGKHGWKGCPVCRGPGWVRQGTVAIELADALRGHGDGRRPLLHLLRAHVEGGVLVYDEELETIQVRWSVAPAVQLGADLAPSVTEVGPPPAAADLDDRDLTPAERQRFRKCRRPDPWLAKMGLLPRPSTRRRP